MASTLKQILRMFFAMEACGILYVLVIAHHLARAQAVGVGALGPWSYAVGTVVFALYAAAFWTTRKPLLRPNALAVVACLLNLGVAIVFLYGASFAGRPALLNAALAALSLIGLFIFLRREKPAASTLPPAKLADIPGDRTHPWTSSIVTLAFVCAAFILEHSWRQWAAPHGLERPPVLLMLLAIALTLTVTAVIHEGGHALVGAVFGMKLLAFTVGPLRWSKREGRWGFKLSRQIFGGSISSAPTHPSQPPWQDVLMIFAGPLANLCSVPVLAWLAFQSPATRFAHLWFFLSFLASLALVVPVLNLIPFRTATGSYSDGARILQIFTASPIVEYQRALRALKSALITPLRPRDLDPGVFQRAAALRPQEYAGLHAHICAAEILEDRGRLSEAAAEIAAAESIADSYAIKLSPLLYTVLIQFEAIHNRSAVAARRWWDRMAALHPDHRAFDYLLAESSVLLIEGHPAEAESAWQKANAAAQRLPSSGAYDVDRERVTLLRTLLDQPVQSSHPSLGIANAADLSLVSAQNA